MAFPKTRLEEVMSVPRSSPSPGTFRNPTATHLYVLKRRQENLMMRSIHQVTPNTISPFQSLHSTKTTRAAAYAIPHSRKIQPISIWPWFYSSWYPCDPKRKGSRIHDRAVASASAVHRWEWNIAIHITMALLSASADGYKYHVWHTCLHSSITLPFIPKRKTRGVRDMTCFEIRKRSMSCLLLSACRELPQSKGLRSHVWRTVLQKPQRIQYGRLWIFGLVI